ncbi:MAG: hypothetical protein Q9169_007016 [Polycauliona sp. 2 TL-2023]
MPFIPHTPESLIARSDSKNPATTCKGITLSGRPCRQNLKTHELDDGVIAVVTKDNDASQGAAAYFCYRHKDQAERLAQASPALGAATLYPLNKRSSTDTLMERLGVVDPTNERPGHRRKKANKEGLPQKWQDVPGPLLAVSTSEKPNARPKPQPRRPHPLLAFLCCGSHENGDDARPLAVPVPQKQETTSLPKPRKSAVPQRTQQPMHSARKTDDRRRSSSARPALADKTTNPRTRPSMPRDPSSQTANLLALIPKTLSPQTTSLLLSELAKPVSQHDEEGYIYIFMLTPTTTFTPQPKDASALLSSTTPLPSPRQRRASSNTLVPVISSTGKGDGRILLKIGRASNIQRRMNEWMRQCDYDLSLVRFYPYIPSSSSSSTPPPSARKTSSLPIASPGVPRKVPHAHKVERLIHIELADKRVKRNCETCGKEHREWFEVKGDREGVKAVDEVVKRWVNWSEGGGMMAMGTGARYHWALILTPKPNPKPNPSPSGHRFHVKNLPGDETTIWHFEETHIPFLQENGILLALIVIAKVTDRSRLVQLLREVEVVQGDPRWTCVRWVEDAIGAVKKEKAKGKQKEGKDGVVGTSVLEWVVVRDRAKGYVEEKKKEDRYNGKAPEGRFDMALTATYNMLEGKEIVR